MRSKFKTYIVAVVILVAIAGVAIFFNNYQVVRKSVKPVRFLTQASAQCGIENCHGLDIVCGRNPAVACDMMYQLGDRCRRYVDCSLVDGVCEQTKSRRFDTCKTCVNKCSREFPNEPEKAFDCESRCD